MGGCVKASLALRFVMGAVLRLHTMMTRFAGTVVLTVGGFVGDDGRLRLTGGLAFVCNDNDFKGAR